MNDSQGSRMEMILQSKFELFSDSLDETTTTTTTTSASTVVP